ncbi:hypothetical protein Patl1_20874 [Pistacia atlantica]|uniref:Uncharacterized protein n=1 Tax=Pistacia atlantica TaxID=434234 RepID=A0ACC1BJR4_9ROSI|nr:hypothetical protein Patl1_20874 [Pistacia atlantica]
MGCSNSKKTDGTETGYNKPRNKDQDVQQSRAFTNCSINTNNGKDEKTSPVKKGNKMVEAKKEKHVQFVEPIPYEEKLIEMEEAEAESEDEPFYSAEEEVDSKKPNSYQKDHAHKN